MSDANSLEWAVVAGAAGAIGSRIVERLAGRGLGVVLVGRTPGSLESLAEHHPRTVVCPADIRDDASIHAIRQAIDGPVRIAVNAAAAPMGGAVLDVTPEAVLSAIDVKVNGTLRLVHAVLEQQARPIRQRNSTTERLIRELIDEQRRTRRWVGVVAALALVGALAIVLLLT